MKCVHDILLVEDDPVLGPLTAESLAGRGHRLTLAPTADEAFEHLRTPNHFTVMILDLQLGAVSGVDLVARLHEANIFVPAVVVFSAQPAFELMRAAKVINASGTLQKPCTVDQINHALQRLVA
ncbi:MAG: response regulator [Rudaea sp.]